MKEKFKIEIKSIQKADMGESENVFSLSPEDQKAIKSSFIDITTKPGRLQLKKIFEID